MPKKQQSLFFCREKQPVGGGSSCRRPCRNVPEAGGKSSRARLKTSVALWKFYISNLEMYIFRLEMYISNLEMYVFRLDI